MQSREKTFHIFGDKNEIELPPRLCGRECTIGIDYLHVEFENPTSNEYIKLIASSARDADNPEGIIYSFFTPARQKNITDKPNEIRYFDLRTTLDRRTIKLISEKKNTVKRIMVRLHAEIYQLSYT